MFMYVQYEKRVPKRSHQLLVRSMTFENHLLNTWSVIAFSSVSSSIASISFLMVTLCKQPIIRFVFIEHDKDIITQCTACRNVNTKRSRPVELTVKLISFRVESSVKSRLVRSCSNSSLLHAAHTR